MNIFTDEVLAFLSVCQHRHFTNASKALHITQSALSQRISKLESELSTILFVRDAGRVDLTSQAQIFLRELLNLKIRETELFAQMGSQEGYPLTLRIGGFSSVTRSVLFPGVNLHFKTHSKDHSSNDPRFPSLQIDWLVRELRDLPAMLRSGQCDLICTNQLIDKPGIKNLELGHEVLRLCKSSRHAQIPKIYLDHDEQDTTSQTVLKSSGKEFKKIKRLHLDDVYGIYDGVKYGWGYGVLPAHFIKNTKLITAVAEMTSIKTPVYLQFHESLLESSRAKALIRSIKKHSAEILND